MTIKKLTTLTLTMLALAASLTFGLMGNHSANAKVNPASNVMASLLPSLSAQVPGANIQVFALDNNNNLFALSGSTFNRINTISNTGGARISGIDFRPANGLLYGISADGSRLFTINPANASATLVSNLSPAFGGGNAALLDFNPVVDAIRLIGRNDQNFAIVKNAAGVLATAVPQTNVAYAAGDVNAGRNPSVVGGSYTNNINGATTTLFYAMDSDTNKIVTIANKVNGSSATGGGQLQTVGTLFVNGVAADFAQTADMDIVTIQALGNLSVGIGLNGNSLFALFVIQIDPNLALGTQQNLGANATTVNFSTGANTTAIDVAVSIPAGQVPAVR